jgi:NADPH:quinone reductase-like Zn-dependent oxidoreductase
MKAVRFYEFGGPEVLKIEDAPLPQPGSDEIRVKMVASSINPIDLKLRTGGGMETHDFPLGTGTDAAGVVDALGECVNDVQVGQNVFGLTWERNAVAEYTLLKHYAIKPDSMGWEQAAALPLAVVTALRQLRSSGAETGQTILIDGASGAVGLATVQFALREGMKVVGTASPKNFELLSSLGAVPVAHGEGLAQRITAAGVDKVDHVFDYSGRMVPELISIVDCDPDRVIGIVNHEAARQFGIRDTALTRTPMAYDALELTAKLWDEGKFTARVGQVFPMDQIAAAQEASKGADGKVIVRIS